MAPEVQTAIAIVIVVACAALVGWRAVKILRGRKTGCGCASCPAVKPLKASVPRPAPQAQAGRDAR